MEAKLNITDQRVLEVFDLLIQSGKARFKVEICETIDLIPQNLRNIRLGKQHFTAENIRLLALHYKVNLDYIFGLEDRVFRKERANKTVNKKILS